MSRLRLTSAGQANDEASFADSQLEIRHLPGFESQPLAKDRSCSRKLNCAISGSLLLSQTRNSLRCPDLDLGFPISRVHSLLRKEVIQPQVPLRLPCYDFIPITIHTFGAFSGATSGTNGFHDVTGGVYKAWERIHGAVADAPLLAIPASCRRVADDNLNWAWFFGIGST